MSTGYPFEIDNRFQIFHLQPSRYFVNDNLALYLLTLSGEPYTGLTVNLLDNLAPDEAYLDVNNCPWAEEFIRDYKLGEPVGIIKRSGYVEYPLYRFDLKKLEE